MSEENQVPAEEVQQETPAQEAPKTEETVVETPVAAATEEVAEEVAPAAVATEEVAEEVVPEAPAFSWADVEGGTEADSGERQALVDLYAETLGSSVEHQVVEGTVTVQTDREVIIDINSKSEGVVSLNEFRYNPELAVGDTVEVLVDRQEDKNGQLVLSHRKARSIKAWDRVNEAHDNDEIVKGYVT